MRKGMSPLSFGDNAEACGCQFAEVPPLLRREVSWKGRIIAITIGLLAAAIIYSVRF